MKTEPRGAKGVAVGCLLSPKKHLKLLRDVLEKEKWIKQGTTTNISVFNEEQSSAPKDYMAIHLNADGCTVMAQHHRFPPVALCLHFPCILNSFDTIFSGMMKEVPSH